MGGGGGWCPTFWFFKSLDNNKVYISLGIDVYVYKRNCCTTKVLWVLKFCEVGSRDFVFFKITAVRTVFGFSFKTLRKKPRGRYVLILSENFKILIKSA